MRFLSLLRRARTLIATEKLSILPRYLEAVGVSTYEQAAKVAKEMLEKGVGAIELCGGFGVRGTDIVARAVDYSIPVGVVRFDGHPGLGGKSGDKLF